MKCKFCYATFDDMHVQMLPLNDAKNILYKLYEAGVQKITFAGGEPILYKWIKEVIIYAHSIGLTTSIITNGSLLTKEFLYEMVAYLDWVGVSIDSIKSYTNERIGRIGSSDLDYYSLVSLIREYDYKLKINTVVNAYNHNEDFSHFIEFANPIRWKVFQTLKVEGQNEKQFNQIKCTDDEYADFIKRHKHIASIVPEDNEAMTGSYLLIDPQGRLFENSKGKHTYSKRVQDNDLNDCLNEISLNRQMFIKRGGIYKWN